MGSELRTYPRPWNGENNDSEHKRVQIKGDIKISNIGGSSLCFLGLS